jgi:hypothetical protein
MFFPQTFFKIFRKLFFRFFMENKYIQKFYLNLLARFLLLFSLIFLFRHFLLVREKQHVGRTRTMRQKRKGATVGDRPHGAELEAPVAPIN